MSRSVEALLALVEALGGVVRTARLVEHGFRRTTLDAATASNALIRPRRGWIASASADPLLVQAARHGVVVTCRTQAARLGLWLHDAGGLPHVAVAPNAAGGRRLAVKMHWGAPIVPRHPDSLVDGIENVLASVAECESFEHGLATWESALSKSLVTIEGLRGYAWRPRARRILDCAMPFADAGLETYLRERLRWLRLPIRVQIWIAGHRVDTLVGDRLVLQIDGSHHVGSQRTEDIRHDTELMLMGYHVIRLSYTHVMFDWPEVQEKIMRAVAQGLHRPR
jgi:very-short-patch-repair endonuclease